MTNYVTAFENLIKLNFTTELCSKQNLIKNFDFTLIREDSNPCNRKLNFYLSWFAGLRKALSQGLQLLRYIEKLKRNDFHILILIFLKSTKPETILDQTG